MRTSAWIVGTLALAVPSLVFANPGDVDGTHTDERIFNGLPAEPCAWPTAVLVSNGPSICTGTLVHPEVVVYAAHCGANGTTVTFGENSGGQTIACQQSMTNPGYANIPDDQAHDWAFCVLPQPVDMPVTPVAFGCNTDLLIPGAQIAIAGFGQTHQMGAGTKHWNMTTLMTFDPVLGVATLGGNGEPSVCPGDSGGPAFIQVEDGTWHAFGIASTVTGGCGGYGTHASIAHATPWIEETTGIDITPCFDIDPGAPLNEQPWTPSPDCGGHYMGDAGVGYGTWADGCAGTPELGLAATCGPPFGPDDETPPDVAITSPEDGAMFGDVIEETGTGGSEDCVELVDVTATASDDSGYLKGVSLRIDCDIEIEGEKICPQTIGPALTAEPFEWLQAAFPAGQYTLTAVAEDYSDNVAESAPVNIGICAEAPDDTGDEDGGTGGMGDEDGGEGCGCSTQDDDPAGSAASWLALLGLGFLVRRRRRIA